MGFLGDLLSKLAGQSTMDYGHCYLGQNAGPIAPDTEYVRIWLRSARITDVRRWSQKFYPAVHARFVYADPALGMREIVSVSSPHKTFQELDSRYLDRFIVVNQPLIGPVPYRGELTSEVALFSVAAENLARPYLDLLANLTETASVSYLSAIEPFIAPIKRGAEMLLLDPGRAELEIGLSRTDTALLGGNIVVARTDKDGPGLHDVTLDPDDWRLLDSTGRPVRDFPYMVLGVERLTERTDFRTIPDIQAGWKKVREAAMRGESAEQVLAAFQALGRVIRFSPDLVPHDCDRITRIFAGELHRAGYAVPDMRGVPVPLAARPPILPESVAVGRAWLPEGRIPLAEARRMALDPEVPEHVVRQLFTADPGASKPFSPAIVFDPSVVAVAPPDTRLEGARAMDWANELAGFRRRNKFLVRQEAGDTRPVLVSVGDSWFQFPFFLDDVIDQLGGAYSIWSLDAAGDTLANMVLNEQRHLSGLRRWAGKARALLLSGSGNDIVGEDPDGIPVLAKIVRPFEAGRLAAWYIGTSEFSRRLASIEACFGEVFAAVAREFPGIPVICHGYDHAIPAVPDDPRRPAWAKPDEWLAGPLSRHLGIRDPQLQRDIVRVLIDRLNEVLAGLCGGNGGGRFPNAWYVNVRGVVRGRWADELHPSDTGFADVAMSFRTVIEAALAPSPAEEAAPGPSAPAAETALKIAPGDDAVQTAFAYRETLAAEPPPAGAARIAEAAAGLPAVSSRALDLIAEYGTSTAQPSALTVPEAVSETRRVLPNAAELPPDAFGALVSLTLDCGAGGYDAAVDPLDRYREMRGIRAAMADRRFADIPPLMRLMKRIWRGTSIERQMNRRREDEAQLFEAGLAGNAALVAASAYGVNDEI